MVSLDKNKLLLSNVQRERVRLWMTCTKYAAAATPHFRHTLISPPTFSTAFAKKSNLYNEARNVLVALENPPKTYANEVWERSGAKARLWISISAL
jgi:hypothetical protein